MYKKQDTVWRSGMVLNHDKYSIVIKKTYPIGSLVHNVGTMAGGLCKILRGPGG